MNGLRLSFLMFLIVSVAYLFASAAGYEDITFYLKPLLLIPLLVAAFTSEFLRRSLLMAALFFCWIGDILLLFAGQDPGFFIGGLIAFLLGHIFYILLFLRLIRDAGKPVLFKPLILVVLLGYMLAFYSIIGPHLGGMVVPVMMYAVVISAMLYLAILLAGHWPRPLSALLVAGAISFVISDSILAINKFYTPLSYSGLLIMTTYIFAQGAIVWALLSPQQLRY